MIKVLHITAHLGGGIGKVLSGIVAYDKIYNQNCVHSILTLEETKNPHFKAKCIEYGVEVLLASDVNVAQLIKNYDIVEVEWWHHPLTMKFMYKYLQKIPCRLVVWSHISGCNYPCIPAAFIDIADKFIFTTPYSYENPSWSTKERKWIKERTKVIVSSGNDFLHIKKSFHVGFNVGYVGFLGYSKIHPQFVKFCETLAYMKDVYFTIVGDTSFAEELIKDIKKSSIKGKVNFTGYSTNVPKILSAFDIFGYPLNPRHTGTAENALLEAMAAGVTPVVLKQCSEQYTVKHMKTGILVESIKDYGKAIKWLYQNPTECKKLGQNASKYVCKNYNVSGTCNKLYSVYEDLLSVPKVCHDIGKVFGTTPYDWFCSCYRGDINNIEGIAAGDNKSGIGQYKKYLNFNESRF